MADPTATATSLDTIVALATARGEAGVGVVRLSGPDAHPIAARLSGNRPLPNRRAVLRSFCDESGAALDEGLVLAFAGPASYTGEDVAELQGHGSPVVLARLVDAAVALGARRAGPGEFTQRAFLNDRLDLAQAEAVADLIAAGTEAAARGALASLRGEFSNAIGRLSAELVEIRVFVEAALDFPEEEVDFLAESDVAERLAAAATRVDETLERSQRGRLLNDGAVVVLAGAPNAGKSSLLNALAGEDRAIVTEIPGTTRDVVEVALDVDGLRITLLDTAGVRDTDDVVEREGVRRSLAALERADHVLLLVDSANRPDFAAARAELEALSPGVESRLTVVATKIDLLGEAEAYDLPAGVLAVAAPIGSGIPELTSYLGRALGTMDMAEGDFTARQRHVDALVRCREHLATAGNHVGSGDGDLVAEELRFAHDALGEIVGRMTADDLLGEIFGTFCIGK